MIYLHCGWPKTGTKTLQAALFQHRDALAAAGVVYPERWQRQLLPEIPDASHNGFVDVLDAIEADGPAVEGFLAFLADNADRDVLISSEMITLWSLRAESRDAVADLLTAAAEAMPVCCVWTLRRFDDFIPSLYLQLISMGMRLPPPAAFVGGLDCRAVFRAMRRFEEAADRTTYVRYTADGSHNAELLRELGVPPPLRARLEPAAVGPRLNPSITHKQALALLEVESLSDRAGIAFDPKVLRRMFKARELEFEDDGPCALIDEEMRRDLRGRALRCAAELGVRPYRDFFECEAGVEERRPATGPARLGDEDLSSLVRAYARLGGSRARAARTSAEE